MIFFIIFSVLILIAFLINSFSKTKNRQVSKVFVINLEKRKERLYNFKLNYNLNIDFEVFKAIDGSSLNLEKLIYDNIIGDIGKKSIEKRKRKCHYELTNINSVGCFLSHFYLWKQLHEKKDDIFLIFEDDTKFNEIDSNEINYRLSVLPDDWDIYLLSDI